MDGRPLVIVAGLGPAGPELVPEGTMKALAEATRIFVRTRRHPAAAVVPESAVSFDERYESAADFETLYRDIVEELVAAAQAAAPAPVVYGVPGSPFVAERTVALLRADPRVRLEVRLAASFAELAWDRLGVDPIEEGVRLLDAAGFAPAAAADRGPFLVGQCHSRALLSSVKLAVDDPGSAPRVTLLHHLGLEDERVLEVAWEELDRAIDPDHLTALWVPELARVPAAELVALEELVRVLRARCPWDRAQTHGSLGRHLLEEAYEALDAIEAYDAAGTEVTEALAGHLEEELGDLLFQVVFHAVLGSEEGRFGLADVARTVHDKLVGRHPHVFGDAVAETPEAVAERWEILKKQEKGRTSITEGIPDALPALALAAKLQRKAESLGVGGQDLPGERRRRVESALDRLEQAPGGRSGETLDADAEVVEAVGETLFFLAEAARRAGVDPETALRAYAQRFRRHLEQAE